MVDSGMSVRSRLTGHIWGCIIVPMVTRTFSGNRLNQLRLKGGFTQEDFAHELRRRGLKTSAKQIRRWESEAHVPRAAVVPILADALGVSMDALFRAGSDDDEAEAASMAPLAAENEILEALRPLARLLVKEPVV